MLVARLLRIGLWLAEGVGLVIAARDAMVELRLLEGRLLEEILAGFADAPELSASLSEDERLDSDV